MKQRKKVAYLVTRSELFFASIVVFLTEQESTVPWHASYHNMLHLYTYDPPTTTTSLALCVASTSSTVAQDASLKSCICRLWLILS